MTQPVAPIQAYCDLTRFRFPEIFEGIGEAYAILPRLKEIFPTLARSLPASFQQLKEGVYVEAGCKIDPHAVIVGPCIIEAGSEIRPGAFLRDHVLIGRHCVVGNSSEVKNSILFEGAQAPHFNYVGDSILGHRAHVGAGVILSNFKSIHGTIAIQVGDRKIDTGLRKFGALLGDRAEVGCNAVLFPGTLVGRDSVIYPLVAFRGTLAEKKIVKNKSQTEIIGRD